MLALASSSSVITALIAAGAAIVSAAILGLLARQAQTQQEQLQEIQRLLEDNGRVVVDGIKQAMRELAGSDTQRRRWYDK